ncbi:hypothetical protein F4777DRAFT_264082 [Nemania sp. FL0916]|nr:hypothetical protein F4777DRAFT_264082 [Nemania sp. FL0916]
MYTTPLVDLCCNGQTLGIIERRRYSAFRPSTMAHVNRVVAALTRLARPLVTLHYGLLLELLLFLSGVVYLWYQIESWLDRFECTELAESFSRRCRHDPGWRQGAKARTNERQQRKPQPLTPLPPPPSRKFRFWSRPRGMDALPCHAETKQTPRDAWPIFWLLFWPMYAVLVSLSSSLECLHRVDYQRPGNGYPRIARDLLCPL